MPPDIIQRLQELSKAQINGRFDDGTKWDSATHGKEIRKLYAIKKHLNTHQLPFSWLKLIIDNFPDLNSKYQELSHAQGNQLNLSEEQKRWLSFFNAIGFQTLVNNLS